MSDVNPLLSSMLEVRRPRRAAAETARQNITHIYDSRKKKPDAKKEIPTPSTQTSSIYEGVRLTPEQQKIISAGPPRILLPRLTTTSLHQQQHPTSVVVQKQPWPKKVLPLKTKVEDNDDNKLKLTPHQKVILSQSEPKVSLFKNLPASLKPGDRVDVTKQYPFIMKNFNEEMSPHYKQVLMTIYYDHKRTAGLASPRKLYLAAKHILPRITLDQVTRWLTSQKTYAVNRVPKKKFNRRKVIVGGIARQYQADLLDMSTRGDDGKSRESDFILTVIDCFSRFADAVPIGRKTASNVLRGFESVFSRMKIPKKIQTDDGKEFYNQLVKQYFEEKGIIHFSTDQELKAQIVERFNRTLREKINKYCQANNTIYFHEAIPSIIASYNSTPHRSLGEGRFAPKDINKRNEALIWELQYGTYLSKSLARPKFRVGDVVRVAAFKKGLKRMRQHFKSELFVIHKVLDTRPRTYLVKTRKGGIPVKGGYYEPQLQKVL